MLLTAIKHYLYDVALNAMFDNVSKNFPMYKKLKSCDVDDIDTGDLIRVEDDEGKWSEGYVTWKSTLSAGIGFDTLMVGIHSLYGRPMLSFNSKIFTIYKLD